MYSLCCNDAATKKLNKLVLRGFNHVNQRLLDKSFCKFTIEATNLQVLQFDDCEFIDDVAIQSIAMNVTQLTDLSISVMDNRPWVTDLGFYTLISCQDLQPTYFLFIYLFTFIGFFCFKQVKMSPKVVHFDVGI